MTIKVRKPDVAYAFFKKLERRKCMAKLTETPAANRLHIGVFGKTNSGKSSFINAFTGQNVSIVADVAGTTTDLVYKSMEISPLGPCTIIDTAGFDDKSELGQLRIEKTMLAAEKVDIAIILISADTYQIEYEQRDFSVVYSQEDSWYNSFKKKNTPVLFLVNKIDISEKGGRLTSYIQKQKKTPVLQISAVEKLGIEEVKEALVRMMPENFGQEYITGNLVSEGDTVLLVMPQDIQAPKGRLILPQVQTIRELLDRKCLVLSVTTDRLTDMLEQLKKPPKLIITDSQVFGTVYEKIPKESMLTSFSILFAAYKGDIDYYAQGAKVIDRLNEQSKVLIAECCTHAPLQEDIGRVKIPQLLKKRFGEGLQIDMVSGTDYPKDLTGYDLIIQCGACMFNRKYVLSRIDRAKEQCVPMTNYGVAIAHLTGILDKIVS